MLNIAFLRVATVKELDEQERKSRNRKETGQLGEVKIPENGMLSKEM